MANSSFHLFFIVFVAISTIFVPLVLATDYTVGDDKGWTIDFNYTLWTQGKSFFVGDRLIFNYEAGSHNVIKVNGSLFHNCTVPLPSEQKPLVTGNDIIPLLTPGRKWYICGKQGHCQANQKLLITVNDVSPTQSPLPTPTAAPPPPLTTPPPSAATKAAVSGHLGFIGVLTISILGLMMA